MRRIRRKTIATLARIMLAAALLVVHASSPAHTPVTHVVCPAGASDDACAFVGNSGVQAAIDAAGQGDTVLLKAGVYAPAKFRDVRYKQYVIRGFVVIEGKELTLIGEPGAVLDGATLEPSSAIVVNGGDVAIRGLTIRNFRAAQSEDDLYDGHGVFIIDARASLQDLTIERYRKMGLTARGSSDVSATNIRIEDGHVAIWLEESGSLRLCNAIVRNNDSAGVAAYVNASARIYNSVFDGNQDDGLYATGDAAIFATNTLLLNNKPYAIRVLDDARAFVQHSVLFGNENEVSSPENRPQVKSGEGMMRADPGVDAQYRSALVHAGDPDVRDRQGAPSSRAPREVAGCARID